MTEGEIYRKYIEDPRKKITDCELIPTPENVWRYRRFGKKDGSTWKENDFWEEDVAGICFFSKPSDFNKNDDSDCKVNFNIDEIIKYANNGSNREQRRAFRKEKNKDINTYKKSLQSNLRIACFTNVKPTDRGMWENENFGDLGRGFCIEYKVDKRVFKPDNLPFLPILYDNKPYDSTEVIKAIIDYNKDNSNEEAKIKMVCLGYGHALIKPTDYEDEEEWRMIIPIREAGVHKNYYNYDGESKRDMSSVITAFYLGYNMESLKNYHEYLDGILNTAKRINVPVYQLKDEETLRLEKIN